MAEEKGSEREVEPRLNPQLVDLREKLKAGTHHGEPFEVSVTNTEMEEAIAWYVQRRPRIPFRNPHVSIHPHGVEARGEARVGKLHVGVGGQATIALQDGLPVITVDRLELGKAGLPPRLLSQVQGELDKQIVGGREDLPVIVEAVRLEEGRLTVRGKIR
jgi:hypothetical protein